MRRAAVLALTGGLAFALAACSWPPVVIPPPSAEIRESAAPVVVGAVSKGAVVMPERPLTGGSAAAMGAGQMVVDAWTTMDILGVVTAPFWAAVGAKEGAARAVSDTDVDAAMQQIRAASTEPPFASRLRQMVAERVAGVAGRTAVSCVDARGPAECFEETEDAAVDPQVLWLEVSPLQWRTVGTNYYQSGRPSACLWVRVAASVLTGTPVRQVARRSFRYISREIGFSGSFDMRPMIDGVARDLASTIVATMLTGTEPHSQPSPLGRPQWPGTTWVVDEDAADTRFDVDSLFGRPTRC